MLKVTNTSNKVVGFRGEDGGVVTVLPEPEKSVEVPDSLELAVKTLEDAGLVTVERIGKAPTEAAEETEEPSAEAAEEETGKTRRGRKKSSEMI